MARKALVCCEELVALIVTNLGRRDLARYCSVSKLWNQCCRWQLAHGRGLGFLIAPAEGSKLWMCDSNSGEEQWVPLGISDSAVLGTCEGLVLIESGGVLAIGEPSVKRWKLLWRPRIDAISAWLGRVEGQLLILIIDKSGAVQKYDFANDSWIDVCRPSRRIALMEECVLIRGGCYRLFRKHRTFDGIYKLDLRRGVWDKMHLSRESARKFEFGTEKKVVEWRGKALMYSLKVFDQEEELREGRGFDTPRLYELLVDEGKVVELPTRLDAANILSPELAEVVSDDYDLFWITGDRDVFKYSVVDSFFNKLVSPKQPWRPPPEVKKNRTALSSSQPGAKLSKSIFVDRISVMKADAISVPPSCSGVHLAHDIIVKLLAILGGGAPSGTVLGINENLGHARKSLRPELFRVIEDAVRLLSSSVSPSRILRNREMDSVPYRAGTSRPIMARKAWAMVVCCEELVALIVTNLGRRDLARCCSVSKLWNRCCRWQLAHGRGLGFLIAAAKGSKLWMCDSNTGEEQWAPLGIAHSEVVGTCEGLVLLESGGVLAIGEPSVKRWKLLWRPRIDTKSAWLGHVQGQLLILIIDKSGAVQKYDCATDSWIDVCCGSRRISLMEAGVLIRGGCYRLFRRHRMFDDIYKLDPRRGVWDKMHMSRQSTHKFEYLMVSQKVVEWRGKALMYTLKLFDREEELREGRAFDTPRLYELLADEGKVVELPTRLDAAMLNPYQYELVSDDYDLFWITRKRDVVKYSVVDSSFDKLAQGFDTAPNLLLEAGAYYYIPDGGEALSRNILSHLPDLPHDY
ncbi:hypothetical protein SELMODRAFT_422060 [Selaginella moellendorffii]|uniref:F-box domain-containing protein n=1 Tax=Selaginella moellendorffii TaxID=88036 RepID=D8SH77_SELML|nr:hypothetical protein SELMODRAFT_422060 [Selaginella moellendorffii]